MTAIVFVNTLDVCPYFEKYQRCMNEVGESYEVFLWDREMRGHTYPANYHVYRRPSPLSSGMIRKSIDFYHYHRFVSRLISRNKHDRVIILSTLSGFLIPIKLLTKFKKRYILDIRDLSYEFLPPFKWALSKLIKCSAFTCISSRGFEEKLPIANYVISHNYKDSEMAHALKFANVIDMSKRIGITYFGVFRGDDLSLMFMRWFGNDERFLLRIVGAGNDTPLALDKALEYNNVIVRGRYEAEEKQAILTETDLILYFYQDSYINNHALANKYYDALIARKPMLVNTKSYSGQLVDNQRLGVAVSDSANVADVVYRYCQDFVPKEFDAQVNKVLFEIEKENLSYLDRIREFLV